MKHRLLLGAHMSIAGSIDQSIDRGQSIYCTTMQIFLKSNRRWQTEPLADEEILNFKKKAAQSSINPIVAHTAYLINLGSSNDDIAEKSYKSFVEELQRAELLGIPYLVVHPGSSGQGSESASINKICRSINKALHTVSYSTTILLETMAGQGSAVASNFESLAAIIKEIDDQKRIGVCFDTCHTWAAGYDFSSAAKYEKVWQSFDATIGLKKLHVIHINDSKNTCGSRVDRHEDIGKGKIGPEFFTLLINDERFFDIPKILETPRESIQDDLRNMKKVVSLISPENLKKLQTPEKLLS